jgi:hypothetical protein
MLEPDHLFFVDLESISFSKLILLRINLDKRARHLGRHSRLSLVSISTLNSSLI